MEWIIVSPGDLPVSKFDPDDCSVFFQVNDDKGEHPCLEVFVKDGALHVAGRGSTISVEPGSPHLVRVVLRNA